MQILIIYDTMFGNTEKIAQAVQEGISSPHEVRLLKAAGAQLKDLEGIDFLIAGSPTHGGRYSQTFKTFLDAIPTGGLQKIKAATFDTGNTKENQGAFVRMIINFFGYAAPRIAKMLAKKGANVTASETFFVLGREGPLKEGEEERARAWAARLL